MSKDIYNEVTETILAQLTAGVVPWRKPWTSTNGSLHRSLTSHKQYRGVNQLLLSMTPFAAQWWVTFKGARKLGGNVRRGEKSTLVVFWKVFKKEDVTAPKGYRLIPMLRYYRVFNIEQCDGLTAPVQEEPREFNPVAEAERILEGMPNRPKLTYSGDSACYIPLFDEIRMPQREDFITEPHFYSTVFHEMVHSTGHKSRLNREEITKGSIRFGDDDYGREELVAEFGASMLNATAGLFEVTKDSSSAYIDHWAKEIAADPKLIIQAAGKAQKASDHILNVSWAEDEED